MHYQSISPPRLRLIHRRIAELLDADPLADPDIVAHHFQRAGDERAIAWLVRAAERAWRTWAWTEAADHFQRAVDALSRQPERSVERAWLELKLAETRRYDAPRRALEGILQAERVAREVDDTVLSTAVRWVRGRIIVATDENGLPDLAAAVAAMQAFDDVARLGFLEHTGFSVECDPEIFAIWLAMLGRYAEALEASGRYLASAPEQERPPLIDAEAYLAMGIAHGALGHPDQSGAAFQAALDIYLRHENHLSEARELARACTTVYEGALTASVEARLALAAGDPDRATRLFDEAAEFAKSLDARPLIERIEFERERSESAAGIPMR